MTCPTDHQLKQLTLGQLSEPESDELFRHLHSCELCQSMLETLDDGEDSLVINLRSSGEMDAFGAEARCKESVALAAAALAVSRSDASERLTGATAIPREFGEYEILRPLGRGGMGSVYLAKHSKLGREVAIKVLASHRLADSRMRERFEQEMRAIGRLSHPNVVTAHDAREIEGTAVLVTEYIDGFDLAQISNRCGPLRIADACEAVRLAAVALQYTSDQGFVHRDVKPSNIMLSRDGEVKLLDLGLARLQYGDNELSELTGTGQAMGTADYVAPEQVTDSRAVDARADIYALGCTLFKLLTGSAPFARLENASAFAKMNAHVHDQAPRLADVRPEAPTKLAKLVDSMLAKEPSDRPEKAMDVAKRLQDFVGGADLEALIAKAAMAEPQEGEKLLPSAPMTQPKTRRRHGVPTWIAIAGGLIGLLLGGFLGVLIAIKYPDGTKAFLRIPDGSEIEITSNEASPEEADETKRPGETAQDAADNEGMRINPLGQYSDANATQPPLPVPLAFAIVESDLKEYENAGLEVPLPGRSSRRWFPLAANARVGQIPRVMSGANWLVLIAAGDGNFVGWNDLSREVSMSNMSDPFGESQTLGFRFRSKASKKLERMTSANVGKTLAVIVNGKVYSASRIIDSISGSAQLSGNFDRGDLTVLRQALDTGMVSEALLKKAGNNSAVVDPFAGDPFGARKTRPRSRAAPSDDPFGGSGTSAADQDPFGSEEKNPFGGGGDDPFGGDEKKLFEDGDEDPFGGGDEDPFDGGDKNPFGGGGGNPLGGATDDPFGGSRGNPFNAKESDPFGGSTSAASSLPRAAGDPFAG
ncbi:MAG: protein kinase, partial [Planctomycetota bacterium]